MFAFYTKCGSLAGDRKYVLLQSEALTCSNLFFWLAIPPPAVNVHAYAYMSTIRQRCDQLARAWSIEETIYNRNNPLKLGYKNSCYLDRAFFGVVSVRRPVFCAHFRRIHWGGEETTHIDKAEEVAQKIALPVAQSNLYPEGTSCV